MEVCLSQRWGTVSDNGWSTVDAQVVCAQLGYNTQGKYNYILIVESYYCISSSWCLHLGATHHSDAYFGQGIGQILLDNVGCSGLETKLVSCSYTTPTSSDYHSEDAGVSCIPGNVCCTVD